MRLAVEVTTCTPLRTGIGYYTEHLVDALLESRSPGDDVVLLSNQPPAPELTGRWAPHLHVEGPAIRAVWMQTAVPRLLAHLQADVAVFPNYAVPLASPCPTVVVVHDLAVLRMPEHATLQKRLLMAPMLKQVAATASVIGTVSLASQSDIVNLLGVKAERTALLPGAAHPSCSPASAEVVAAVRARHGLTSPYVLTVGTLEPRKDLHTLLRAFDRLRAEGETRELVVVGGRGWKDAELLRALEARAGSRGVRWLGYVGEADLAALYTGADLFAFTPKLEGFGLPLLEAMACGTPVVASDVPALREVGGDAARFVPTGDDQAFARAIADALRDAPGRRAQSEAGHARAKAFSWRGTAEVLWARARAAGPSRVRPAPVVGRDPHVNGTSVARADATTPLPAPLHPAPASLTPAEWALLAAVVYADLFSSPLPLDHAVAAAMGVALDLPAVRRLATGPALASLVTLHPHGYLVLAGRESLVAEMPEREAMTRALLDKHRRTLAILEVLPFVRGLVVSGGVAHRNVAGRSADIDLFVIAAAGRAYTAYTMLFLATTLTGTRRIICPNYIVDESELAIAYHRDLFTAHQLVSAKPMSGHPAYAALCAANTGWVRQLFPSFAARPDEHPRERSAVQAAAELAYWPAGPVLEALFRTAWRVRLRRRAAAAAHADVVLADGLMKLHLSDYRARVLARFAARLQDLRGDRALARPGQRPEVAAVQDQ
jgi:glycosyltransferase involved in cell wall biosynthesis